MIHSSLPRLDANVLDRYLAGECSVAECEIVGTWLNEIPDANRLLAVLQRPDRDPLAWDEVRAAEQLQALRARILQRISIDAEQSAIAGDRLRPVDGAYGPACAPELSSYTGVQRMGRSWWSGVAKWTGVVSAGVVMLAAGLYWFERTQARDTAQDVVYVTRNAQQQTLELFDGTRVTLNVASQLTVPAPFHKTRAVHLSGEAYFLVTHNAGIPFVVEAGQTRTLVLGTEFGVKSYDQAETQISVRSGRVEVNGVVLAPRDIAHVAHDGTSHVAVEHQGDVVAALSFSDGKMTLTNMTLREAIPDLNRWYDVDIQLGDAALGDKSVYLLLEPGTAEQLEHMLSLTFGVQVVRTGKTLILYPRI